MTSHALVVGIAGYTHAPALPASVEQDARDVRDLLVDPARCRFPAEQVQLLLGAQATGPALRDALRRLATASPGSTVVVFFSGHGARTGHGEFLLPVDARLGAAGDVVDGLPAGELTALFAAIPATRLVVLLDCCHAGGIGEAQAPPPPFQPGLSDATYAAFMRARGRAVIASSREDERSWVLPGARNSVFTTHLLAGLRGAAAAGERVTLFSLFAYLVPQVLASSMARQHPVLKARLEDDLLLALSPPGQAPTGTERLDAVVSYVDQEPDAAFVWTELMPRLDREGLRVAAMLDAVAPGGALVAEIEQAVRSARRTVVVLSDRSLQSAEVAFQHTLALTHAVDTGAWRVLPVKFDKVTRAVPTRLSQLVPADLSNPHRRAHGFERLVAALRSPPPSMVGP